MHIDVLGSEEGRHLWLFHGNAAPPDSMSTLAEALADEFLVHVPHFPGYGRTPHTPECSFIGSLSQVAAHVTRTGAPVVLVGHSFGLYRVVRLLDMLEQHRVLGVFGLSGISTFPEDLRQGFVETEAWARSGHQIGQGLAHRWFSPDYLAAHDEVVELIEGWWADCDIEAVASELFEPFDGGEANRIVSTSTLPMSLLVGSADVAAPVELSEAIASLRDDVTLEVIDGAGHFLHIEEPTGAR